MWHDQTQENKSGCFYAILAQENRFKKETYGTESI